MPKGNDFRSLNDKIELALHNYKEWMLQMENGKLQMTAKSEEVGNKCQFGELPSETSAPIDDTSTIALQQDRIKNVIDVSRNDSNLYSVESNKESDKTRFCSEYNRRLFEETQKSNQQSLDRSGSESRFNAVNKDNQYNKAKYYSVFNLSKNNMRSSKVTGMEIDDTFAPRTRDTSPLNNHQD